MKAVSGKDFTRLLEKNGWKLQRIKGSHHIYTRQGHSARISVPVHGKASLKTGLLKYLMNIAGIDEKDL